MVGVPIDFDRFFDSLYRKEGPATKQDLNRFRHLLTLAKFDLNLPYLEDGETILTRVLSDRHIPIDYLRVLFKWAVIDVNRRNRSNITPLQVAISNSTFISNEKKTLAMLKNKKVKVLAKNIISIIIEDIPKLTDAVLKRPDIGPLLSVRTDGSAPNWSAMFFLTALRNTRFIKLAFQKHKQHINLDMKIDGKTILDQAIEFKNPRTVEFLLKQGVPYKGADEYIGKTNELALFKLLLGNLSRANASKQKNAVISAYSKPRLNPKIKSLLRRFAKDKGINLPGRFVLNDASIKKLINNNKTFIDPITQVEYKTSTLKPVNTSNAPLKKLAVIINTSGRPIRFVNQLAMANALRRYNGVIRGVFHEGYSLVPLTKTLHKKVAKTRST